MRFFVKMFICLSVCLSLFCDMGVCAPKKEKKKYTDEVAGKKLGVYYTFISPEAIRRDLLLKSLDEVDPGHYKTLIWFENFPIGEKVIVKEKRLAQKNPKRYVQRDEIVFDQNGQFTASRGSNKRDFVWSSRGYLPGERIFLRFQCTESKAQKEISFIPNPILAKDHKGKRKIDAELDILSPTMYTIKLHNFPKDEKIKMKSVSEEEVLEHSFYPAQKEIPLMPGVLGVRGGISTFEIKYPGGNPLVLHLPWGTAFFPFFLGELPPLPVGY